MFILVDNNDSFTFNLYQYFLHMGAEVLVMNVDDVDLWTIRELNPMGIIVSPGPGHPKDMPNVVSLIREASGDIPILGVCLGFQAIGYAFHGSIIKGNEPMHGKVSFVSHDGTDIFANIPSPFGVARYHSLVLDSSSVTPELIITAKSSDGVVMGIRHRTHRTFGVQFHPESILTEHGMEIVSNFIQICMSTKTPLRITE